METTNTPTLLSSRLILRKFTEADIQALFLLLKDEQVNTYLPWFPAKTLSDARTFYEQRFAKTSCSAQGYKYAVCLKEDNIPIGYVQMDAGDAHDIGYALRKEFWHRGIMREAVERLIVQLRKDKIPYITATHDINNVQSGRVMQAVGMQYMYSYKEQWQPKNIPVIFNMYQLNLDGEDRIYTKYREKYRECFI